jgi:DNA modification methylase
MIHQTDARVALPLLATESIDLIVTDPPYRCISGGPGGSGGRPAGVLAPNTGRVFEHNDTDLTEVVGDLYRVLRSPGHAYVMTNLLNLFRYRDILVGAGFKVHNLLVWRKQNVTPNRWYMKNGEFILFVRKGPARAIYTPGEKMITDATNPTGNKRHETEKPVDLMERYIRASTKPGEIVLDPFMGCGTTGVAAIRAGRRFLGFELDPKHFETARGRLSE